jgi:hypothetical protein
MGSFSPRNETKRFFGLSSFAAAVLIAGGLLLGVRAEASPLNCDNDFTSEQIEKRTWCDRWGPCAFVMSIMDTCVQTKTFLSKLGVVGKASDIDLDRVSDGVRGMAAEVSTDGADGPKFSDCMPGTGDRPKCRQYLGIEKAPIVVPYEAPLPDQDTVRRTRMLALYKENDAANSRLTGPWSAAASLLESCESARTMSDREATCRRAQRSVDDCNASRQGWNSRKQALLQEIDQIQPGIGKEYTPGISTLRGVGRQANRAEMWNDTVRGLRGMEIPACPSTIPGSALTPTQMVERWKQEEAGAGAILARCDANSRDLFAAIDDEDVQKAEGLLATFRKSCSGEAQTYAERAALATQRLATLQAARLSALPRRSTGSAAALVQQAIAEAEFDERNPGVREARKRAEAAARQEAARQEAAESAANTAALMSGLLDLVQGAANIRAVRGSDTAAAIAQGLSQRTGAAAYVPPQAKQPPPSSNSQRDGCTGLLDGLGRPCSAGANSAAASQAYQAEAARAREFDRQVAARAEDEARYYPVMHCVQPGDRCHQNNCGRRVAVFWTGAQTGVRAGYCYPSSSFGRLIGACEIGSTYDSKRGQCKK